MKKAPRSFLRDESGATAIEYALIAILISVTLIGGAGLVGGNLSNALTSVGDTFTNAQQ